MPSAARLVPIMAVVGERRARQLRPRDRDLGVEIEGREGERREIPALGRVTPGVVVDLRREKVMEALVFQRAAVERARIVGRRDGLRLIARATRDDGGHADSRDNLPSGDHPSPE
jgi:hypothetical protein